MPTDDDIAQVTALLGRRPQGRFEVVVRDAAGGPVVIRNEPLLESGRPMPTRYWLVGRNAVVAVSRLEASGAIDEVEAELGLDVIAEAHDRYRAERDAALAVMAGSAEVPSVGAVAGPRPSGGVAGTRIGVKCLHAHYAWFLAGGDDPIGRWVAERLPAERMELAQ